MVGWWDRRQVGIYLGAIVLAAAVGLLLGWIAGDMGAGAALGGGDGGPARAVAGAVMAGAEWAIEPLLGLLLFATFLGVPLVEVGRAVRDLRFLGAVLVVNFVVVPVVVFGLSRFVADEQALLTGVLLVLLTPCVDYVIVFAGLAGGDRGRLLAATPLLMLAQIVLLPVYLAVFAALTPDATLVTGGTGTPTGADGLDAAPFVRAFVLLIALPLVAAALVQLLARLRGPVGTVGGSDTARSSSDGRAGAVQGAARRITMAGAGAMVPLMAGTLAVVVCSQVAAVGAEAGALARVVPLYVGFLVVMLGVGIVAGRVARLPVPRIRALTFSGATRNSLVVLPIALALPAGFELAPLAVVTQTLVELVGMVVFVKLVPALVPERPRQPAN
ncbi:arsenic resistance protein [Herbiconiux liukaitaii]|uniref:arsenic resistance protein n=1 Tax=Herbiconiux liukaitaii TaxID=3342799 RepID=UPI0035BB60D4